MAIEIVQETAEALPEYGRVPMAFMVRPRLSVEVVDRGAGLSHRRKSAATSLGRARLRASELGGADGPDQKLQPTP